MNKDMENIKEQLEEVINKNLPEEKKEALLIMEFDGSTKSAKITEKGYNKLCKNRENFGFNQALSQINTSLIADEVLKVVVEKIEELRKTKTFPQQLIHLDHSVEYFERLSGGDIHYNRALEDLLSNLSPHK